MSPAPGCAEPRRSPPPPPRLSCLPKTDSLAFAPFVVSLGPCAVSWVPRLRLDEPGLAIVEEYLQKGVFVQSEGAVGIFNEEVKHMPFFMLRKTRRHKLVLDQGPGAGQAQVRRVCRSTGRSTWSTPGRATTSSTCSRPSRRWGLQQADKCEHVPYEMVELPSGAMATRKGNVILFRALRERMLEALESQYLGKYRGRVARRRDRPTPRTTSPWARSSTGCSTATTTRRSCSISKRGQSLKAIPDRTSSTRLHVPVRFFARRRRPATRMTPRGWRKGAELLAALEQPEERELIVWHSTLCFPTVHQAAQTLRPVGDVHLSAQPRQGCEPVCELQELQRDPQRGRSEARPSRPGPGRQRGPALGIVAPGHSSARAHVSRRPLSCRRTPATR